VTGRGREDGEAARAGSRLSGPFFGLILVIQPHKEDAESADALVCMADNVSVRPDDPQCLHPSGFCRFRDFCQVLEAARKKRRSERRRGQNESDD